MARTNLQCYLFGGTLKKLLRAILYGTTAGVLALGSGLPAQAAPGDVDIPDANLRSCINGSLGQAPDAAITEVQAAAIGGELVCKDLGIASLAGMGAFSSLAAIDISRNRVADLAPLSGLVQLVRLKAESNPISDISALAPLANLTSLNLNYNPVADISALAGMKALSILSLYENKVTDISPLSGLTKLSNLDLYNNNVSDVSPLAGMGSLGYLRLSNNNVTDISALANLASIDTLVLSENPISDVSFLAGLPVIRSLALNNTAITEVTVLSGMKSLQQLFISNNNISDVSALSLLTGLSTLHVNGNHLADISALAELTNLVSMQADNQRLTLPEIFVGARQESPLVAPDGSKPIPTSSTAEIGNESGDWVFTEAGDNVLTWSATVVVGAATANFAGTISQRALPSGLSVTDPDDVTVAEGENAAFTSIATSNSGNNTVIWESSSDGGLSWATVPGAHTPTLTIEHAPVALSGTMYRAIYTNDADGAVASSAAATLTVTPAAVVPGVTPSGTGSTPTQTSTQTPSATSPTPTPTPQAELASTGAQIQLAAGGMVTVAAGLVVLLVLRRRARHASH